MLTDRRILTVERVAITLAGVLSLQLGVAVALVSRTSNELLLLEIVFAAVGGVAIMMRPLFGLVLIILWLNSPVTRFVAADTSSSMSYLPAGMVGLLLLVIAILRETHDGSVFRAPLDAAISAIAAIAVIGSIVGIVNGNDTVLLVKDASQAAEFVVYYFVASRLLNNLGQLGSLLTIMIVSAVATALMDIFLFMFGQGNNAVVLGGLEFPRVINNFTAMLPALFVANILLRRSGRILTFALGFACSIVALLLSFTRSLWLGAFASVVVILLLLVDWPEVTREHVTRVITLCVGLLAAALLTQVIVGQPVIDVTIGRVAYGIEQLTNPANALASRRQDETVAAIQVAQTAPLFGIGYGGTYLSPVGSTLAELETGDRHFIHDTFLAVLLRTGVVGFGLLLFSMTSCIRYLLSQFRRSRDAMYQVLYAGTLATLVGGMFVSLTADALFRHPFAVAYGALLGLCASRATALGMPQSVGTNQHDLVATPTKSRFVAASHAASERDQLAN